jgi:hypothetical protein
MHKILLTLLSALCATVAYSGEITGAQVIDSGPLPSDNAWHTFNWANNTGKPINIRKVQLAVGQTASTYQYFTASVAKGPSLLVWSGFSDSETPDSRAEALWEQSFGDDYVCLNNGEQLTLWMITKPMAGYTPGKVRGVVTIWYTCD